ncbi:hypothetical protein ACYSNR_04295 [Enterococcus sp. LJL128]
MAKLNENQESFLYDLRANFKIDKSAETAIYNTFVDTESFQLSNNEFVKVMQIFCGWVLELEDKQ